jgi:hypothetical protein
MRETPVFRATPASAAAAATAAMLAKAATAELEEPVIPGPDSAVPVVAPAPPEMLAPLLQL